jgi:hypothetical protein
MTSPKEKAAIARRWLQRGTDSRRYIRALERRLASLPLANITRYENDGAARTEPRENMTETRMLEYSELKRSIEDAKERSKADDKETRRMLAAMYSNLQRSILEERYIYCLSWEDIAKMFDYSVRHIHRLHGAALLAFYQILHEGGKDE